MMLQIGHQRLTVGGGCQCDIGTSFCEGGKPARADLQEDLVPANELRNSSGSVTAQWLGLLSVN